MSACLQPLHGWYSQKRNASGKRSIVFALADGLKDRPVSLACGSCVHCLMERRRDWTVRVVHESQLYDESCFITVTYDDAHLPWAGSLHRKDFQDFLKRLRKEVGDVRVFYCGEYGDRYGRPHYHAVLFGFDFADKEPIGKRGDFPIFRSAQLQRLWERGRTEVGTVSAAAAAYVAGYVIEKLNGEVEAIAYEEELKDVPFVGMSLKPGIGFWWFLRNWREVYPMDRVVLDGRKGRPPLAYDRWLAELEPEVWREVKRRREDARVQVARRYAPDIPYRDALLFGAGLHPDSGSARAVVIREVAVARLTQSKRRLS